MQYTEIGTGRECHSPLCRWWSLYRSEVQCNLCVAVTFRLHRRRFRSFVSKEQEISTYISRFIASYRVRILRANEHNKHGTCSGHMGWSWRSHRASSELFLQIHPRQSGYSGIVFNRVVLKRNGPKLAAKLQHTHLSFTRESVAQQGWEAGSRECELLLCNELNLLFFAESRSHVPATTTTMAMWWWPAFWVQVLQVLRRTCRVCWCSGLLSCGRGLVESVEWGAEAV